MERLQEKYKGYTISEADYGFIVYEKGGRSTMFVSVEDARAYIDRRVDDDVEHDD